MAKKHYVKDEELGGIEREYVGSDRKAEVGDLIVVTKAKDGYEFYDEGHIGKVVFLYKDGEIRVNFVGFGNSFEFSDYGGSAEWFVGYRPGSTYKTLVPTGNVRIDGEIYRTVDRKAQVGEKVIVVENKTSGFREGHVGIIYEAYKGEALVGGEFNGSPIALNHYHDDYRVLEPVEAPDKSDKTTADLLANLSREVVRLQKRVNALEERADSNAKDIVTFAEELTEHKAEHGHGRHAGKFETLDERLQRADAEDLAHNVARFVTDYLKEGLRYERNN